MITYKDFRLLMYCFVLDGSFAFNVTQTCLIQDEMKME